MHQIILLAPDSQSTIHVCNQFRTPLSNYRTDSGFI